VRELVDEIGKDIRKWKRHEAPEKMAAVQTGGLAIEELAARQIISEARKKTAAICLPGEYTPEFYSPAAKPRSVS